jgi:6,7-dimethyl-8-ribityllumazine synthase
MSKYNKYSGKLSATGLKIGIVVSRWHELVNSKLLEGAVDIIERQGGNSENIDVFYVPGSFELSIITKKISEAKKYDCIITLGCIIRGHTLHFDLLSAEVVKAISQISMNSGVPIAFGVLTTDTLEQALERAGSKQGNKGVEAALSAIEMANLIKEI